MLAIESRMVTIAGSALERVAVGTKGIGEAAVGEQRIGEQQVLPGALRRHRPRSSPGPPAPRRCRRGTARTTPPAASARAGDRPQLVCGLERTIGFSVGPREQAAVFDVGRVRRDDALERRHRLARLTERQIAGAEKQLRRNQRGLQLDGALERTDRLLPRDHPSPAPCRGSSTGQRRPGLRAPGPDTSARRRRRRPSAWPPRQPGSAVRGHRIADRAANKRTSRRRATTEPKDINSTRAKKRATVMTTVAPPKLSPGYRAPGLERLKLHAQRHLHAARARRVRAALHAGRREQHEVVRGDASRPARPSSGG